MCCAATDAQSTVTEPQTALIATAPDGWREAVWALDLLTLKAHTEAAGDRLDPQTHRAHLLGMAGAVRPCLVWRNDELVAYALLRPHAVGEGFVLGFCLHPAWRNAGVLAALMKAVAELCAEQGWTRLHSHVYKTNRASLAFHRRLGFGTVNENDKALAFVAELDDLRRVRPIARNA